MSDLLPTELQLNIVSPDHLLVRDSVSGVTVPGKNGYIGVLPGHAPLLTLLVPGELSYTIQGVKHYLCVNLGFAEVLPDRVIVLVQSAERAEEIDVERAQNPALPFSALPRGAAVHGPRGPLREARGYNPRLQRAGRRQVR